MWMKKLAALTLGLGLFAAPAMAAPVDRRDVRQEQRIREGMRTGQLSPREAMRLQRQEDRLRFEKRMLRGRQGGMLTQSQRNRLDRQHDRLSRRIYAQKHDCNRR